MARARFSRQVKWRDALIHPADVYFEAKKDVIRDLLMLMLTWAEGHLG